MFIVSFANKTDMSIVSPYSPPISLFQGIVSPDSQIPSFDGENHYPNGFSIITVNIEIWCV